MKQYLKILAIPLLFCCTHAMAACPTLALVNQNYTAPDNATFSACVLTLPHGGILHLGSNTIIDNGSSLSADIITAANSLTLEGNSHISGQQIYVDGALNMKLNPGEQAEDQGSTLQASTAMQSNGMSLEGAKINGFRVISTAPISVTNSSITANSLDINGDLSLNNATLNSQFICHKNGDLSIKNSLVQTIYYADFLNSHAINVNNSTLSGVYSNLTASDMQPWGDQAFVMFNNPQHYQPDPSCNM